MLSLQLMNCLIAQQSTLLNLMSTVLYSSHTIGEKIVNHLKTHWGALKNFIANLDKPWQKFILNKLYREIRWEKFCPTRREEALINFVLKFTIARKNDKLIKLDWLPGFTCQRKKRVDKKSLSRRIFSCWKIRTGQLMPRAKIHKLYVVLENFYCCLYSVMQEPTADMKSTAWTESNKRENKFRIFRVHEQTKKNRIYRGSKKWIFLFFLRFGFFCVSLLAPFRHQDGKKAPQSTFRQVFER